MRLSTRRLDHNCQVILQVMIDAGEIPAVPGVRHVVVAHDARCGIHRGHRCDCNPDIEVAIAGRDDDE